MKASIIISEYIKGRYNSVKLDKLKVELERVFTKYKEREGQSIPDDGLEITISMSAKYQTAYVKCENWGKYLAVGELENLIKDALESRGFEIVYEDGDANHFKFVFE